MLLAIFLILYSEGSNFKVHACISNPQSACSVASYQYSAACRAQIDAYPQQQPYAAAQAVKQYNGFLGESVNARAYSERGSSGDFAKLDQELQCRSVLNCTWRNVEEDQLDWVLGEGGVDPAKIALITGSTVLPDNSFFILASDPRPPFHGGMLVSMPIGCQQSTGILSFRYWRSRSRTFGSEPDLDVCTRKALESTLDNCLTITPTPNHTVVVSIPPLLEPFEIVLRGFGFENEPEGGVILIDQIDYFAHLDQPENCAEKPVNTNELEKFTEGNQPEKQIISGDTETDDFHRSLVSNDVKQHDVKTHNTVLQRDEDTTAVVLLNGESDFDNEELCKNLRCFIGSMDTGCEYQRVGKRSSGRGFSHGWKALSVKTNVANRLTGIHISPQNDEDAYFLFADFPGFSRNRQHHGFVLESPIFALPEDGSDVYLGFKKYCATQGLELNVCEDPEGLSCFWKMYQNSAEPFRPAWTMEVALLPSNITKLYFLGQQDFSAKANEGQLGITQIDLYLDEHESLTTGNLPDKVLQLFVSFFSLL